MTSGSSFLDWDEPAVQAWLVQQGYGQYEDQVIEQGINGEALSMMDIPTLQELGITSIGHRLGILKAVWQLKLEQGIELGDDDWRPADEPRQSVSVSNSSNTPSAANFPPSISYPTGSTPLEHGGGGGTEYVASPSSASGGGAEGGMWGVILEQNERIAALERSCKQLFAMLSAQQSSLHPQFRDSAVSQFTQSSNGYSGRGYDESRGRRQGSEDERREGMGMGVMREEDEEHGTLQATPSNARYIPFPSPSHQTPPNQPLNTSTSLTQVIPESSVLSPSTQSAFDPSTTTAPVPIKPASQLKATPPALPRMMSASGITGTPISGIAGSFTPNTAGLGTPGSGTATTPTPPSGRTEGSREARDAAGAAAKSFRVTLEDPCWKVLPAALKKYKINDDWRQYAMFICFGNTERCLSYDEKPLLLFQKLKEANQKPVFMLRHIRDIKSPIAVAQQKQAARASVKPSSSGATNATGQSSTNETTPTSSTNPHPYSKDTRLHRPPVLQPLSSKSRANGLNSATSTPGSGNGGNFPELPSPSLRTATAGMGSMEGQQGDGSAVLERKLSYAVAIYPYSAEREDEFDVTVGSAFIICNKAKGWWVVQKDPDGSGSAVIDESQTGWVPAGCLLELSEPLQNIACATGWESSAHPNTTQPIPPTYVLSSSFAGIALMDYQKKGEDELNLTKDDLVRVFKRYNHWSAAIITSTGERGWVPSWYIGKKQAEADSADADKERDKKDKSAEPGDVGKAVDGRV